MMAKNAYRLRPGLVRVILRYNVEFFDERWTEWCAVGNPEIQIEKDIPGALISKKEAKEYIAKNGLELAYKCKDGEVYDTPDLAYLTKYSTPEQLEKIQQWKKENSTH